MLDDLIFKLASLIRIALNLDAKPKAEMLYEFEQPRAEQTTLATPSQVCKYQNLAGWMLKPDKDQFARWQATNQAIAFKVLEIISNLDGDKIIRFTKPFYKQVVLAIRDLQTDDYDKVAAKALSSHGVTEDLADVVIFAAQNGACKFENYDPEFIESLAVELR